MNLIKVEKLEQLKELYDSSAMTWEGLIAEDFETALDYCCKNGRDGTGYVMSGADMNGFCHLTGRNAYPDKLTIFMIKDFKGLAMTYGARWLDDIIDNNARREGWHPFHSIEPIEE